MAHDTTTEPTSAIHISGLIKLETCAHASLDETSFEAIMKQLGKDCGFIFQSVTTHPADPNIVGARLLIQVHNKTRLGQKGILVDRLTRTFAPVGYEVEVQFI